ncbi:hypothetical protein CSV71_03915 [Sporosarcina sp. P21c]|uniref:hypothetical protein n=1 Tax=unclassified Sporosarcina TaxID=2647733 RepID=UPI000C16525D|nr:MULTISPECIES: hypothetical protein [unclassified Sporosarcina]PIC67865.1 hypothetical protein CSV78_06005 [Sporosarcina sp. P16a]PIC90724.1 hypothetical protein CSV71_03915 [Sporosarcina sp. P21c]PIC93489.1 hypothetical protein CSV70_05870 [Sporosarcina sp. P25]
MNEKWTIRKNQQGMSVVELLATLLLVSLVFVIIWTTFSISTRLNTSETAKLRLQQEANYIATEAQRLHRKCLNYEFVVKPQQVSIQNCRMPSQTVEDHIISTNFIYYTDQKSSETTEERFYVNTKRGNLEIPKFWIIDPKNEKLKVSIPLELSRYKEAP